MLVILYKYSVSGSHLLDQNGGCLMFVFRSGHGKLEEERAPRASLQRTTTEAASALPRDGPEALHRGDRLLYNPSTAQISLNSMS